MTFRSTPPGFDPTTIPGPIVVSGAGGFIGAHVLDALSRLSHRGGVEGIADHHLRSPDFVSGGLERVSYQHAQLVTGIKDLVRDATADKAGRTQEENSCHGSES